MLGALSKETVQNVAKQRESLGSRRYMLREHLSHRLFNMVEDLRNQVFSITRELAVNYIIDTSATSWYDIPEHIIEFTMAKRKDELKAYYDAGVLRALRMVGKFIVTSFRSPRMENRQAIGPLIDWNWLRIEDKEKFSIALQQARFASVCRVNDYQPPHQGTSNVSATDFTNIIDTFFWSLEYTLDKKRFGISTIASAVELILIEAGCCDQSPSYESDLRHRYKILEQMAHDQRSRSAGARSDTRIYDINFGAFIAAKSYSGMLSLQDVQGDRFVRHGYRNALDWTALQLLTTIEEEKYRLLLGRTVKQADVKYCSLEKMHKEAKGKLVVGTEGFADAAISYVRAVWDKIGEAIKLMWSKFSGAFSNKSDELSKALLYMEKVRAGGKEESTKFLNALIREKTALPTPKAFFAQIELLKEVVKFFPVMGDHLIDNPDMSKSDLGKMFRDGGMSFTEDHQVKYKGRYVADENTASAVIVISNAMSYNTAPEKNQLVTNSGNDGWTIELLIDAADQTAGLCDASARMNRIMASRSLDAYREYLITNYEETKDNIYLTKVDNFLKLAQSLVRFSAGGTCQLADFVTTAVGSARKANG